MWNSERLAPLRFYGCYFRWPLFFLLLALAVDKLLYYGGLPLAGHLRQDWDDAVAERALAAHRDRAALVAVRQALLESRTDARSWRLAARISDRLDLPEAAYCWLQADRLDPGSPETEWALTEAALRQGRTELAAAALHELSPARQAGLRYAIDAGQVAQAQGRPERARYWFEQAEGFHPTDTGTLFILASWHGGQADPADLARTESLLIELAAREESRLAARRALVALDLRRRDFSAARRDENALLATPGVTFPDQVAQLDLATAMGEPVEEMLAALLHTGSPSAAARVLDWMTAHGRAEEALIWIRREDEVWQDDPAIGAVRAALPGGAGRLGAFARRPER